MSSSKFTKQELEGIINTAIINVVTEFFKVKMAGSKSRAGTLEIKTDFADPITIGKWITKTAIKNITVEELAQQNNLHEYIVSLIEGEIQDILINLTQEATDLKNLKTDWKLRLKFFLFPRAYKQI